MLIADRYEVQGKPLVGGMATVFPCEDSILLRKVAIKVMPGVANQRRVRDELTALLKMRSKHVVQVYDILRIGEEDLGIVQEFIDGQDLFDPDTAPKTVEEYLKLLWQIAAGISDIHALGVIHRDIKPNNMKVDGEGVLKIFDFGLARDEGHSAATIGFVGTPGYAAPELHIEDARFTQAVDTYAFGATALFLALSGLPDDLRKRPPKLDSAANYFASTAPGLALEVAAILNLCLAENPTARPKMEAVRNMLAKHLLYDRHRALVVFQSKPSFLDSTRRTVHLRLPGMGEIKIGYDGFQFNAIEVVGDVYVNNRQIQVNDALPGACVVALGAPEKKNLRRYITFDLSHPEIVL